MRHSRFQPGISAHHKKKKKYTTDQAAISCAVHSQAEQLQCHNSQMGSATAALRGQEQQGGLIKAN